ncbi:hypothetical protein IGW_01213 [Bacillus cereus ISP3191]|nr:hypothetical protein IGW_01213 [Bacillus cereus ISP3191]
MNFFKTLKTNFRDGTAADKLSIISSILTILGAFSIPSLIYLQYAPNLLFSAFLICGFFVFSLIIIYFAFLILQFVWQHVEETVPRIIVLFIVLGVSFLSFSILFEFLKIAYRDIFSKITQI